MSGDCVVQIKYTTHLQQRSGTHFPRSLHIQDDLLQFGRCGSWSHVVSQYFLNFTCSSLSVYGSLNQGDSGQFSANILKNYYTHTVSFYLIIGIKTDQCVNNVVFMAFPAKQYKNQNCGQNDHTKWKQYGVLCRCNKTKYKLQMYRDSDQLFLTTKK